MNNTGLVCAAEKSSPSMGTAFLPVWPWRLWARERGCKHGAHCRALPEAPAPPSHGTVPLGKLCGWGRSRLVCQQREEGEEIMKAIPWEKLNRKDPLTWLMADIRNSCTRSIASTNAERGLLGRSQSPCAWGAARTRHWDEGTCLPVWKQKPQTDFHADKFQTW